MPRPFDPEAAADILERVASAKTLMQSLPPGVTARDVQRWRRDEPEFAAEYELARAAAAELWRDEAIEIADDDGADFDDDGEFRAQHVQRARLRIDTRLKLLRLFVPAVAKNAPLDDAAADRPEDYAT